MIYKPPGWEVDGHETEPDSHALRRMASHGIAWHRMASHGIAWHRMASHGIAWCFFVLGKQHGPAEICEFQCLVLKGLKMLEVQVPENLIQVDCLRILCPDVVLERVLNLGTLWCFQFRGFPTLSKTPWIHGRCMRVIVASCIAWTCRAVDWWGDTNSLRIPQSYYCITIIS